MNERNILLVAVLIIAGVFVVSYLGDYTGSYVAGPRSCEYPGGESQGIFKPNWIIVDDDANDGIPERIMRSKCATDTGLSTVGCRVNDPYREIVQAPTGYVCVTSSDGSYFERGSVDKVSSACSDSDGGANRHVRGIVTIKDARGRGLDETGSDFCATIISVTEATCSPSGDKIERKILNCVYPETCAAGVCS